MAHQSGEKPTASQGLEGNEAACASASASQPCGVEDPMQHRNSMRENREAQLLSAETNSGGPVGESDEQIRLTCTVTGSRTA